MKPSIESLVKVAMVGGLASGETEAATEEKSGGLAHSLQLPTRRRAEGLREDGV